MVDKIQANGASIAYALEGPEDKDIVILSNSLMSTMDMWKPQIPVLHNEFQTLRYDTRGHGQSEITSGPYSISLLANDVLHMMDGLRIEKAHFVGLSMGGMIGQYLGANHADRFYSLGLCDTASEMPTLDMWNDRISTARNEGIEGLVEGTLQRWFTPSYRESNKSDIDFVADMIRTTQVDGYIANATAVRDMSLTAFLKYISVPTLVMTGREDPACTLEASEIIHEQVAGSKLVVIDDAAHLSNIEKPDVFNEALFNFLMSNNSNSLSH